MAVRGGSAVLIRRMRGPVEAAEPTERASAPFQAPEREPEPEPEPTRAPWVTRVLDDLRMAFALSVAADALSGWPHYGVVQWFVLVVAVRAGSAVLGRIARWRTRG